MPNILISKKNGHTTHQRNSKKDTAGPDVSEPSSQPRYMQRSQYLADFGHEGAGEGAANQCIIATPSRRDENGWINSVYSPSVTLRENPARERQGSSRSVRLPGDQLRAAGSAV